MKLYINRMALYAKLMMEIIMATEESSLSLFWLLMDLTNPKMLNARVMPIISIGKAQPS